jgi:hypothetical protein
MLACGVCMGAPVTCCVCRSCEWAVGGDASLFGSSEPTRALLHLPARRSTVWRASSGSLLSEVSPLATWGLKFTSRSPWRCILSAAGFLGPFLCIQDSLARCPASREEPAEEVSESELPASGLGESTEEGAMAEGPWPESWACAGWRCLGRPWDCRHSLLKASLQSKSSSLSEPISS